MKKGDHVKVYPHGYPDKSAIGTIAIISGNEQSIAVGFDDSPPFAASGIAGAAIHPEHGIMLFAYRGSGNPWGPWIELFNEGHYEIEAI